MKVGDLVRADAWVEDGGYGIIISIQDKEYCVGAYVLMANSVKLIRVENLWIIPQYEGDK